MAEDLEEFVERYHRTVEAFITGDPSPQERIWSRRDDVTLANPLGPPARGSDGEGSDRPVVSDCARGAIGALDGACDLDA